MLEGHLGERAIAVEEPWRRSFTLGDLRSLCRSSDWLLSHPTQRVYYPILSTSNGQRTLKA
jgi:hypothetical protein